MQKNEKCVVSDSVLCKWLNRDCEGCFVAGLKDNEDAQKTLEDFEVTLSLLPKDIDTLQDENCCFCIGEPKKRAAYAVIDLGHSEPANKKGMFFGFGKKVRQRIGSLMPVSISICKRCRRVFRMVDLLKWASLLVFIGIGVGICFLPAINQNPALPYGVVIVSGIVGYVVGKLLTSRIISSKSRQTRLNVFEIPVCAKMGELGWFTVQDDAPVTHFLFSKKPMMSKIGDLTANSCADENTH